MDPKLPIKAPRKMKFAPKPPPKREAGLVIPKVEKNEIFELDDAEAEHLRHRLNEASFGKPKVYNKAGPVQVAFGPGGSSSSVSSYAAHKNQDGAEKSSKKEYQEPWDYNSYYPITVPLRRPYAGNPELLNEEEFGENSETSAYDEDKINTAEELGLLEEDMNNKMIFLKLPSVLPSVTNIEGEKGSKTCQEPSNLESLPKGHMGKMLVYKSGAVKMKLGNTIYDVSSGVDCSFPQDVVAINAKEKHCCIMGEISKRVIVTPDIDHLLDSSIN